MHWEYMQQVRRAAHTLTEEEANKLGQQEWQMIAIEKTEDARIYWFSRPWRWNRP